MLNSTSLISTRRLTAKIYLSSQSLEVGWSKLSLLILTNRLKTRTSSLAFPRNFSTGKFKYLDSFYRRRHLESYFTLYGVALASIASYPMLGTPNHIPIFDDEKKALEEGMTYSQFNTYSASDFVLDTTFNEHPRFGGLVKSIRERRGEKVTILAPIFEDEKTDMTTSNELNPIPG